MKQIGWLVVIIFFSIQTLANDSAKLYNPAADAEKDIQIAIQKAKKANKHVLIQAGGNWCSWCIKFNKFTKEDKSIDSLLQANFIIYHLNYSPENRNNAILKKYGFPQRFGFPVFLVLDATGKLVHTQNSAYLEEGKGYSKRLVLEFLRHWSPAALSPANYKDN